MNVYVQQRAEIAVIKRELKEQKVLLQHSVRSNRRRRVEDIVTSYDDIEDELIIPYHSFGSKSRCLTVKGVVGDGIADDTLAIQRAIKKASKNNAPAKVVLPKGVFLITSTIKIPAGITLMGQGYGSSPLAIQFDAGGSTLAYCGTEFAVKITGHAAALENLGLTDWRK